MIEGDYVVTMDYPEHRPAPNKGFYDGILDAKAYLEIKADCKLLHPDATFIALVGCIDKAVIFEKSITGIEPFSYFVANLPEPLRHVIHLGIYFVSFNTIAYVMFYRYTYCHFVWGKSMYIRHCCCGALPLVGDGIS